MADPDGMSLPTAQTSLALVAATPFKYGDVPTVGLGTTLHAVPL